MEDFECFYKKNGKQTLSVESIEVSIGYLCIWLKDLLFDKKKNYFSLRVKGPKAILWNLNLKIREVGSSFLTSPFCFFSWQFYCIIFKTFENPILEASRTVFRVLLITGTFENQSPGPLIWSNICLTLRNALTLLNHKQKKGLFTSFMNSYHLIQWQLNSSFFPFKPFSLFCDRFEQFACNSSPLFVNLLSYISLHLLT